MEQKQEPAKSGRGARVSEAMLAARTLIEGGATQYAAAKATGITQSAISKSKWWRDRKAAQAA